MCTDKTRPSQSVVKNEVRGTQNAACALLNKANGEIYLVLIIHMNELRRQVVRGTLVLRGSIFMYAALSTRPEHYIQMQACTHTSAHTSAPPDRNLFISRPMHQISRIAPFSPCLWIGSLLLLLLCVAKWFCRSQCKQRRDERPTVGDVLYWEWERCSVLLGMRVLNNNSQLIKANN